MPLLGPGWVLEDTGAAEAKDVGLGAFREQLWSIERKLDALTQQVTSNLAAPRVSASPAGAASTPCMRRASSGSARFVDEVFRQKDAWMSPTPASEASGTDAGSPRRTLPVVPDSRSSTMEHGKTDGASTSRSVPERERLSAMLFRDTERSFLEKVAILCGSKRLASAVSKLQATAEDGPGGHGGVWAFVHGGPFQTVVSTTIMLHALLAGWSADNAFRAAALGAPLLPWVEQVEVAFAIFFTIELALRVIAEGCSFLFGSEWRWNLFDSVIVISSLIQIIMSSNTAFANMSLTRILRVVRFLRLMRISRVMKHLRSLRTILFALLDSFAALFWCFVFLAMSMYVFAIVAVYGAAEWFLDHGQQAADLTSLGLLEWWGGVYRSMITLFLSITGGQDWYVVMTPLKAVDVSYEFMFVLFIFYMAFGVLNVVVGAFVAATAQIMDGDKESVVKYEIARFKRYGRKLTHFFAEADVDKSGTLSWEEFRTYLEDPKVKAYFHALDLDVTQAHTLFHLLDLDNSNQVTLDEFLEGCLRLKGSARSVDLNMLLMMCEKVFDRLMGFIESNETAVVVAKPTDASSLFQGGC